MGFRLAGMLDNRTIDLPLVRQQMVLGSGRGCDLPLSHHSVSRSHARLIVHGDEVEVVDLGSTNGTFVGSSRILSMRIRAGSEVSFGSVTLRLAATPDGDLRAGLPLPPAISPAGNGYDQACRSGSTLGLIPAHSFATDRLGGLLELLAGGATATAMAQATAAALIGTLPVVGVGISCDSGDAPGMLYRGAKEIEVTEASEPLVARLGGFAVELQLPHPSLRSTLAPMAEVAVQLVALAAGTAAPGSLAARPQPPPLPAPESVDTEVRRIYSEAAAVAEGEVGVLVSGESGTGKEVLGRYIHRASPRASRPFVALNCAALPHDLLEAELFGIERGVATGVDERPGKFELADGGTLFLDEIGDMSLSTQASILRVLQEAQVYRVGAGRPRSADVRVIAATNRDMGELLRSGRFREDLYYRIATWEVTVPPLRRRSGDVANLAAFFLEQAARQRGVRIAGISEAAFEVVVAYSWPGNVRQLQKEMARAALFVSDGGLLTTSHLAAKIVEEVTATPRPGIDERVETFLRREIIFELQVARGDIGRASAALGISRSTLYRRIKSLGIDPDLAGTSMTEDDHG